MSIDPTCRKCKETEDGPKGFLLECCGCKTWIHPACHKPNVSIAAIRSMISTSDRARGAPGSLEVWICRDCSRAQSAPLQETIDLTLDDDDDEIQEVQPTQVKNETQAAAPTPSFEPYTPSPYLDTLIRNKERNSKAYLKVLFPSNHTRNNYNVLFTTEAVPNPLRQWLHPEPASTAPQPVKSRKRKAFAKHVISPTTSQLVPSGKVDWTSWEA